MADHGKIRGGFNDEQFEAFCEELRALPAKQRTLEGIAALFEERTGLKASVEAARTFKGGPFARYLEKLEHGRQAREALCAAAGAGVHPLDALEEAAVIELQDHLTNAESVDVEWLGKQLVKLRMSISMREDSRRKNENLERLQSETAAKLQIAEQRGRTEKERADKLERERAAWEAAQKKVAEANHQLRSAKPEDADAIRAKVVTMLDDVLGITPKK